MIDTYRAAKIFPECPLYAIDIFQIIQKDEHSEKNLKPLSPVLLILDPEGQSLQELSCQVLHPFNSHRVALVVKYRWYGYMTV